MYQGASTTIEMMASSTSAVIFGRDGAMRTNKKSAAKGRTPATLFARIEQDSEDREQNSGAALQQLWVECDAGECERGTGCGWDIGKAKPREILPERAREKGGGSQKGGGFRARMGGPGEDRGDAGGS